ncbi:MAG: hypothetical protein H8D45_03045 [Bacteroidetes bacterium]|nr:hypothetical protein [Bacteroidota bacterium]
MKLKQTELKEINIKPLKSLDKSLKLVFYVNINENNKVDINYLKEVLFKPLILEIKEDLNIPEGI